MPKTPDFFCPRTEPAKSIYYAFQEAARLRENTPYDQWKDRELHAVFEEARAQAGRLGLAAPTYQDVVLADQFASGHVDYGALLAYRVVEVMLGGR